MAYELPVSIEWDRKFLREFFEEHPDNPQLPATADGKHFAPYTLKGPQVGSVVQLAWHAEQLEQECLRLQGELEKRDLKIQELQQTLDVNIDATIAYLDPDQK